MQNEVWKSIKGYEGVYEVSNLGRIKSLSRVVVSGKGSIRTQPDKILSNVFDAKGYLIVRLCKGGRGKNYKVHRLVAEAFIPNPNQLPGVNHKAGIKSDNRVSELEWCTQKENVLHAVRLGLRDQSSQRMKVHVFRDGQQIDTVESINATCSKYKIGKTTLLQIVHGKREKIGSLSFSL